MRDEDTVRQAFEAQASSADESRELCDIFGLDSGGRHEDRRDRLLSLLSGPSSRSQNSSTSDSAINTYRMERYRTK
eukprot:COSAG02_NODE_141_length_34311_cov_54.733135_26_plen_76_part_00